MPDTEDDKAFKKVMELDGLIPKAVVKTNYKARPGTECDGEVSFNGVHRTVVYNTTREEAQTMAQAVVDDLIAKIKALGEERLAHFKKSKP